MLALLLILRPEQRSLMQKACCRSIRAVVKLAALVAYFMAITLLPSRW